MFKSKNNLLYIFLIILSVSSFIYGFTVKEDSAGGGFKDFNNTWNNQMIFNEYPLIDSIKNTKTSEIKNSINSHFPFSYILNKIFNPFSKNKEDFLMSIFILNMFIPLLFFLSLKNNYSNKNLYLIGCLSSILYLSPYFRTSAYWAGMENYGLFTFIISFYFFSNYQKKEIKKKLNIVLFSISSCLCVYFDQKLLLVPLIYMFLFFKNEKNRENIILYLIINFILSIPVLALVYYWGSIISPYDTKSRELGNRLYLEQIGFCFSMILFYLSPYLIIYHKKIIQHLIGNKKIITISTVFFCVYLILILIFPTDYGSQWSAYGNGWLDKLSKVFFEDNFYRKAFVYLIFFISIIILFTASQKRPSLINFTIFFILVSSVANPIFQEYFDPLMLIFLSLFFYREDEINDKFIKFHYFFSMSFLIFMNLYY